MSTQETYRIFDLSEDEYTVKPATNANIRDILRVPTQAIHKTNDERIYYAQEADIRAASYTEEGHPVYRFDNIFMPGTYWPALAQQLFFDCPEIVKVKKGKPSVANEELYDSLNREEVRRAFNTFLGKFGCTPFEVRTLLNAWDSAQTSQIMEKLAEMQAKRSSTLTPSQTGEPES